MVNAAMTLQSPTSTQSTNTPAFLLRVPGDSILYQKLAQWEITLYSHAFKEKRMKKPQKYLSSKTYFPPEKSNTLKY